jgi:hypothetical protein
MLESALGQSVGVEDWKVGRLEGWKIDIILLNWNAADDTLACLERVARWQQVRPVVWVVDNASGDESANRIEQALPARGALDVRLIRNPVNLGYAGGNNCALSQALARNAELILLLNNDAILAEGDLIRLIETLCAEERLGIVGPLLYEADRPDHLLTAGGRDLIRHLTSHLTSLNEGGPVVPVDYVPGTVLLSKAEVFRAIGLLDEDYFFSGELPDFCRRAKAHGWLSALEVRSRAYHQVKRSSNFRRSLYPYYIIRNRFRFIGKFCGWDKALFFGFWALYSLALALKLRLTGQAVTAKAVWLGLNDGLRGRFGGQNERVLAYLGKTKILINQNDLYQLKRKT